MRHYVEYETLLSIYHALFQSHIQYSCHIWGFCTQESLSSISKLQNKALRIIHFKKFRDPVDPLYQQSKILKLKFLIKLQHCSLAYQHQMKKLPIAFTDFCLPDNNRPYATRSSNKKLKIPDTSTQKFGSNSIQSLVAKHWNKLILDKNIAESKTMATFKHKLKKYYLRNKSDWFFLIVCSCFLSLIL